MKHLILASMVTALAGQASALSCLRPDVVQTFTQAAQAEELYAVLLGDFQFDAPPSTDTGDINAPQAVSFPAVFVGDALNADGFAGPVQLDVTVDLTCAGPWCGSMSSGSDRVLAFVEQSPDGYTLSVGPCFGTVFTAPLSEDIARVEACKRGAACDVASP